MRKLLVVLLTVGVLFSGVFIFVPRVDAASLLVPIASENIDVALRSYSLLVATSDGYMRVFYDGSAVR